jgi:hypothetical protein
MTIRVRCGVVDEAVETGEELDRVLDGIERGVEVPVLVALSGPDSVLHVGLGAGEASVAPFMDSDRRPWASHCLGDDAVEAPTFAKDGRYSATTS